MKEAVKLKMKERSDYHEEIRIKEIKREKELEEKKNEMAKIRAKRELEIKTKEDKKAISKIKNGIYPDIFNQIKADKFGRTIKSLKRRLTESANANDKDEVIRILGYFLRVRVEDEYKIYIPDVNKMMEDVKRDR